MFLIRQGAAAWHSLDDGVVILDVTSSAYLKLNASASQLWELLAEGAEREQLTGRLRELGASAEVAERDTQELLTDLMQRNLIEEVRAEAAAS